MPTAKTLSPDDIREIVAARGILSAKEIQKKFGIGATRLYKIWREHGIVPRKKTSKTTEKPPARPATAAIQPANPATAAILPVKPATAETIEKILQILEGLEAEVEETSEGIPIPKTLIGLVLLPWPSRYDILTRN